MRHRAGVALLGAGCLLVVASCSPPSPPASTLPIYSMRDSMGRFTFVDAKGDRSKPVGACYYRPATWTDTSWIVFFFTGSNRTPADVCSGRGNSSNMAMARRYGFLLIAPEFHTANYPGRAGYNFGGMVDTRGRARPRDRWSLHVIEHLFDAVRHTTGAQRNEYLAYGFSAGAQYINRVALFLPEARARRLIAADAGAYAVPDAKAKVPFGIAGSELSPEGLRSVLARDFIVFAGDQDTSTVEHAEWEEAQAQGPHRLARAQWMVDRSRQLATDAGAAFAWRFVVVPGLGHEGGRMAPIIIDSLFSGIQRPVRGVRR
jgi:hypothetical protein